MAPLHSETNSRSHTAEDIAQESEDLQQYNFKGKMMWKKDSKPRLLDSGVFEASKDQHCEIYLRDDSGSA